MLVQIFLYICFKKIETMALFTVRIELHSVFREDHQVLQYALRNENFTTTIRDESGAVFILPTSEYNKEGEYSKEQVLDSAIRAATKTGKEYSIIVTESGGRCWANLTKVK